jgi:hypothetical protein
MRIRIYIWGKNKPVRQFTLKTNTYLEFRTAKEPPILPPIVAIAMARMIPNKTQKFLLRTPRIVFCCEGCVGYGAAENGGGALRGASSQYV